MSPESAPKVDCNCSVCLWTRSFAEHTAPYRDPDSELEMNYQRYRAGELVSREEKD